MLVRALLLALLLLAPLALAIGAPPPQQRTDSRTYVGPTHDTSARFVACQVPAPLAVDGACFALDGSERAVDITIADATQLPILAHVFFRDASGIAIGGDFVCTASSRWSVPSGAATLNVWMLPDPGVNTPGNCPTVHGQATVGTVAAAFT